MGVGDLFLTTTEAEVNAAMQATSGMQDPRDSSIPGLRAFWGRVRALGLRFGIPLRGSRSLRVRGIGVSGI